MMLQIITVSKNLQKKKNQLKRLSLPRQSNLFNLILLTRSSRLSALFSIFLDSKPIFGTKIIFANL
ncbi:hypothetical protein BpHYR1_039523 [Brachionus plicatilis]|uniref:Uncharacterized protein n=1 Tax=Brachionus plicatilis TaxID=10195 RepID=A0A3M7S696_BRAPC|nr:hypothetical protein BpHYR1_039523 [Brachionus plicatilis]